jgi:hypothetical protein
MSVHGLKEMTLSLFGNPVQGKKFVSLLAEVLEEHPLSSEKILIFFIDRIKAA